MVILEPVSNTKGFGLNLALLKPGPFVHASLFTVFSFLTISFLVVGSILTFFLIKTPSTTPIYLGETFKNKILDIHLPNLYKNSSINITQPLWGNITRIGSFIRYTPMNLGQQGFHYSGDVPFYYSISNGEETKTYQAQILVKNHPPTPSTWIKQIGKNVGSNIFSLSDIQAPKDDDLDVLWIKSINRYPKNGDSKVSKDQRSILYTPNKGFSGYDNLEYVIDDGNDTTISNITFNVINDPPKCEPVEISIPQNKESRDINLLKNCIDNNGDKLSIVSIQQNTIGKIELLSNGVINYYPKYGIYSEEVEYTISDGESQIKSKLRVQTINSPPFITSSTYKLRKKIQNQEIPLEYGDPDPFSTLSLSIIKGNGYLDHNERFITSNYFDQPIQWKNNTWKLFYNPIKNGNYQDDIELSISDGIDSSKSSLQIQVLNLPPVVYPYELFAKLNFPLLLNVTKDYDPDGDELEIENIEPTSLQGGVVKKLENGNIEYQPPPNYIGKDSFRYVIKDKPLNPLESLSTKGTVNIIIEKETGNTEEVPTNNNGGNNGSNSNNGGNNGSESVSLKNDIFLISSIGSYYLDVLKNDIGKNLTISKISTPSYGKLILNPKYLTFQLTSLPTGDITFFYNVNDMTASVLIKFNQDPGEIQMCHWREQCILNLPHPIDSFIQPLSGSIDPFLDPSQNQRLIYHPKQNFIGNDTFQYSYLSNSENALIIQNIIVYNSNPIPKNYTLFINEALSVINPIIDTRDDDILDKNHLYISNIGTPAHGRVQVKNNQIFYQTNPLFKGVDSFLYDISDGKGSGRGSISIHVLDSNEKYFKVHWRVAQNGFQLPYQDSSCNIVEPPNIGRIQSNCFDNMYYSQPGFTGFDFFIFGNYFIIMEIYNNPPISKVDYFDVKVTSKNVYLDVLKNDYDEDVPQFDQIFIHSFEYLGEGKIELINNQIFYTPPKKIGLDHFTYKISDGLEDSMSTNVFIKIEK